MQRETAQKTALVGPQGPNAPRGNSGDAAKGGVAPGVLNQDRRQPGRQRLLVGFHEAAKVRDGQAYLRAEAIGQIGLLDLRVSLEP